MDNILKFPSAVRPIKVPPRQDDFIPVVTDSLRERAAILKDKSRYSCNYDFNIIESLERRLGETFVRGGILHLSPVKTTKRGTICIDSYGRGNVHDCSYDPVKRELEVHAYWNRPFPMPADITTVWEMFYKVFETKEYSICRESLESRRPVRLGYMSDCFMYMDKKYKVTPEILNILKYYDYPYTIETHSDLIAHDDYLSSIDTRLCERIDIPRLLCDDPLIPIELHNRIHAPGAPGIKRRGTAIARLRDKGLNAGWRNIVLDKRGIDMFISKI